MDSITKDTELVSGYKNFLDSGKTERECVTAIVALAEAQGYKNIESVKSLSAGDKVYVRKMNKSVMLVNVGSGSIADGMNILGAHIDSPRLDVKQNPIYDRDFVVYLNTHYYGGIKKYQWVTMPLAIHGVICKTDGTTVTVNVGEKEDDPVFCISDILPHMAQDQMKEKASEFIPGEILDLIIGSTIPAKDNGDNKDEKKPSAKKAVLALLEQTYGIKEADLLSAELEVVPAGKARDSGFDRSLILAYGQDDRSCAYTSVKAMLDNAAGVRTNCCVCVDKEEIGSTGATGMASHLSENMVSRVVEKMPGGYSELTLRRCLENSCMLSSDVNAAFDPLNGGLYDKDNASFLGGGIVFNKYTGSRGKYSASDANAEYLAKIRGVMDAKGVRYQMSELGKVDQGGGGTIALYAAKYGMNVLDAGVPVLSMHAPWELTAKEDIKQAYAAYCAFLSGME